MNKINPNNFEIPKKFTIVYLGAEWCGPCRNLKPEIENILQEFPEEVIYQIEVDEIDRNTSIFKDVKSIPAIRCFENGEQIYHKTGPSIHDIRKLLTDKKIELTYWEKFIQDQKKLPPTHYRIYEYKNQDKIERVVFELVEIFFKDSDFNYETRKLFDNPNNGIVDEVLFLHIPGQGSIHKGERYFLDIKRGMIFPLMPDMKAYSA